MSTEITPSSMARYSLLLAWLLILSGCATLSKDECHSADWQLIGYEDGARGQPASRIGKHREACAKYDVKPDMTAYERGRAAGLKEFCRPETGYRLGLRGAGYAGVCPPELEGGFAAAYRTGKEIYGVESQIGSIERRIASNEREVEQLREEIVRKEAELVGQHVPSARRLQLLEETKEGSRRIGSLEQETAGLRVRLGELRVEADHLRAASAYE